MSKKTAAKKSAPAATGAGKTLVIAEKPSVAADLAKVLKVPKAGEVFEDDRWVISSAVGHLVELKEPHELDPEWKGWTLKSLPILPRELLEPIKGIDDHNRWTRVRQLHRRLDE